jgi:hypothetical protein
MRKGLIATVCAVMLVMAGGLLWNASASTMGVPSLPNFSPVHTVGCGGPGRCPWGSRWVCGPYGRCGCAPRAYVAPRVYVAPRPYVSLLASVVKSQPNNAPIQFEAPALAISRGFFMHRT